MPFSKIQPTVFYSTLLFLFSALFLERLFWSCWNTTTSVNRRGTGRSFPVHFVKCWWSVKTKPFAPVTYASCNALMIFSLRISVIDVRQNLHFSIINVGLFPRITWQLLSFFSAYFHSLIVWLNTFHMLLETWFPISKLLKSLIKLEISLSPYSKWWIVIMQPSWPYHKRAFCVMKFNRQFLQIFVIFLDKLFAGCHTAEVLKQCEGTAKRLSQYQTIKICPKCGKISD